MPRLTPVCELVVELGEPLDFGVTRDGSRRRTPVLGGELRGLPSGEAGPAVRGLRAAILPGGGDRQLLRGPRRDGEPAPVIEIDASYDARTEDGALIALRATGIRRVTPVAATGGSGPDAARVYFRVTLRFETSAPELAELQDSLFVADGVREASRVRHTVYRVD